MDLQTKDAFLTHSRSQNFKRLVESTKKIIKTHTEGKEINVSVSGGKDSLVLLHITLLVYPNPWVWHWDYGIFMPKKYEDEIIKTLTDFFKISDKLRLDKRMSKDPNSSAGYKGFFAAISNHLIKNKIELNLIGLRSGESCMRKTRCKNLIEPNKPCPNFFPLKDWSYRDIWAYIVSNQIPYPDSYDIRAPLLGWDKVRFVTFFDPEFLGLASIEQDKFFFYREME